MLPLESYLRGFHLYAPVHHSAADVHDSSATPCVCPICELPPPPQDDIPFPIYEGCREKHQQFLLDYY